MTNAGIVQVLFVAAAMVAIGLFAIAWRRDLSAAIAGVPLLFAGAGIAFVGVARFSARAAAAVQPAGSPRIVTAVSGPPLGQEVAVLLAIVAVAVVALGVALAMRAGRVPASPQESAR